MKLYKLLMVVFAVGAVAFYFNEKSQNHFHGIVEDVNAQDERGQTALLKAISDNRIEDVITLINNGADLELADDEQCTPLHSAIRLGNVDSVAILIAHGAQGNVKDRSGKTPLEHAKEIGDKELIGLFEIVSQASVS